VDTPKVRYLIRFKDIESAEAARNNVKWPHKLENTKLGKARFGVVVHQFLMKDFDIANANAQAIENIMKENDINERGLRVEDIAQLIKKDQTLGDHASLGIWFDNAEGVDYILGTGFLVGQRYIGSVKLYELKRKRRFRWQRFGHFAWPCKETPRFCQWICKHIPKQHLSRAHKIHNFSREKQNGFAITRKSIQTERLIVDND
jgi:hypothetical protein